MDTALATPEARSRPAKKGAALRGYEKVVLAYFTYLPCLAVIWGLATGRQLVLASLPVVLWVVLRAQSRSNDRIIAVLRDWWPLGLILVGYWAMGWFAAPPLRTLETTLLRWDRLILHCAHLQTWVEAAGPFFPAMLDTIYLFVYAIPPIGMGVLYACGARSQAPRFLCLVFAGAFATYALLPYVPVISPRVAFPDADLPHYHSVARSINTWLLDHLDISTSVLPSGHVAVAFSSAFGMVKALPQRPVFGRCALGLAGLVYLATIYGRYHYAVDGLVSLIVVSLIFQIVSRSSLA